MTGWIEAASQDEFCPFSLAYLGRAPARVVLPRSSPEVDNPRYPPHVQVVDQVDLDPQNTHPHGCDTISAGLDFDEKGNELDDDEFSYDDEDPD